MRTIFLLLFLGLVVSGLSQFNRTPAPGQSFSSYVQYAENYFDSLRVIYGDTILRGEGSDYAQYQLVSQFWRARLNGNKSMEDYDLALKTLFQNQQNFSMVNADPWFEIGPKEKPNSATNQSAAGIGPISHFSFYKGNPQLMLCSQAMGGIFFSQDGGQIWNKTGTDTKLPFSGVARAIFHPSDPNTWFASCGGEDCRPGYFLYTRGIYRTTDGGNTWTVIADYTNMGWLWNKVNELKTDPTNGDILYAATNNGLYKTINATAPVPAWVQLTDLAGKAVYDFEVKANDPQTLFATVKDNQGWSVMESTNGGQNWNVIPGAPVLMNSASLLTIEVSNASPDFLFCLIALPPFSSYNCGSESELWYFDLSNNTWSAFNPANNKTTVSFGAGFGFAVNQVNGQTAFTACGPDLRRMDFGNNGGSIIINSAYSTPITNKFHPDIERVICHPTNSSEIWLSCHGGIYQSVDNGLTWQDKSTGLGIAEVVKMANAWTDESLIVLGLNHDGSPKTETSYYPGWNPQWRTMEGGDGTRPIIDDADPSNIWVSAPPNFFYFSSDGGQNFSLLFPLTSNWQMDGVLDKTNPATIFRPGNAPVKQEVQRSFNRGLNGDQVISNFQNTAPYNSNPYAVFALYTPQNKGNYLFAKLFYDANGNRYNQLWRTKNANDPNPTNVVWEKLPLPVPETYGIESIDFDELNPDTVYLAFSSSNPNPLDVVGQQMIFKMDYTNPNNVTAGSCQSGLCKDLTFNLPNTGISEDGFVLEKQSNGALYAHTDAGVYYTNNEQIYNNTGWLQVGSDLPHAFGRGIQITYPINKLRVATNGRGVWEHDLVCPTQNNLTLSGTNNGNMFREAQASISSNEVIASGDVKYRGGTEIELTNGFGIDAAAGTSFGAFIHPCNLPGNSFMRRMPTNNEIKNAYDLSSIIETKKEDKESHNEPGSENGPAVYPNPSSGNVNINFITNKSETIIVNVFDITGKILHEERVITKSGYNHFRVSFSDFVNGIYFLKISGESGLQNTCKVVLNR